MIRREVIEGKQATVAYLDDKWQPVEPEKATLIKVIFDDGRIVFAVPTKS